MLKNVCQETGEAAGWRTRRLDHDSGRERPRVLIVVHQRRSHPGHVGRWFRDNGFALDIRLPRFGDALPETLEHHAGAVIFGGPMSANDGDAFVRQEIDWLRVPLSEDKPFLGICLGAQMLALHLGGRVGFHPEGYAEIGYHPIRPTEAGAELMDWPACVYQWHREGLTLPSDAVLLAQGHRFENQAFRFGPAAYGVQFHPEITHHLVQRWTTAASHRLVLPGATPRRAHIDGHIRYGPAQRRWLGDFLSLWSRVAAR